MKEIKSVIEIIDYDKNESEGPITWQEFQSVISGLEIMPTDIIKVGPYYSYWDGEKDLDGYEINITRNVYETDEEEAARIDMAQKNKKAYEKYKEDERRKQYEQLKKEFEK